MPRTPRSLIWRRLLFVTALVLLLTLLVQTIAIQATPPDQTIMGLTCTPTTVTTVVTTVTTVTTPPTTPPPPPQCKFSISCVQQGVAAKPGDELSFSLRVENGGDEPAVKVIVTDDVSENLEILEVTTTKGRATIEGQRVTVDGIDTVDRGFPVEVEIRARVRTDAPAPLEVKSVAYAKSDNCGEQSAQCTWWGLPVTGTRGRPQRNLWIAAVGLSALVALGVWEGIRFRRRQHTD